MSASISREVALAEFDEEGKEQSDIQKLARDMRENLAAHIELNEMFAKTMRAKYVALVAEGFSSDQALLLCK